MEFDTNVLLAATTAYGATVTKTVDAIRKFDKYDEWPKAIWNVLPLAIGAVLALLFGVNVITGDGVNTIVATLLTGLAIGASASGWHEVFDALSGTAKSGHAKKDALQQYGDVNASPGGSAKLR